MVRPLRIGITSGDQNGIGPEVIAKALRKIGPQKSVQFFLWRSPDFPRRDLERIKKSFKLVTVSSWTEALKKIPGSTKEILDICANTNPGKWVEEAASACVFKHIDGMATAPLSKPTIKAGGLKDLGHTDILKRVSRTEDAYMAFIGEHFNILLATGHTPIKDISRSLTLDKLLLAIRAAIGFSQAVQNAENRKSRKPIGILGLNPHAGDDGLIGLEDQELIKPAVEIVKKEGLLAVGPLVPDAAFTPSQWPNFSVYLALYHDQGLIPFKAIHGQNGLHLTWGLPFVRTSVDHGTAFDIAGEDKADATSMQLAIEWAVKLCSGSN